MAENEKIALFRVDQKKYPPLTLDQNLFFFEKKAAMKKDRSNSRKKAKAGKTHVKSRNSMHGGSQKKNLEKIKKNNAKNFI